MNCGTRPPGRVIFHRLLFPSEAFPREGEGRLPLTGGDVERSETEGVGDLAVGQTDEGEAFVM